MRPMALLVAFVSIPALALAQGVPLGTEFRVNTQTQGFQRLPAVAQDTLGNFVVVWGGYVTGAGEEILGQRYIASGAPSGAEFRVNTSTTGFQYRPAVASDPLGNLVVAWESPHAGGSYDVFGQRYAASGAPVGSEFRMNTYTSSQQVNVSVAADPSGSFVVVWQSAYQDGSDFGVFGQRYSSSGAPVGPEFRVNTYTTDRQSEPSVAADSGGSFVVVWQSHGQDGSYDGIFGQRYASTGAPLGPEFRVNTATTGAQYRPSVATEDSGNFVVVWDGAGDGSVTGIFGQRYDASGVPQGPEFRVNTYTTVNQARAVVASDPFGSLVVTWWSDTQDGDAGGIFGQRYAPMGVPLGPEFRVNTYTTSAQFSPAVATDSIGRFVVVWQSYAQDGSDEGVYAQRYAEIIPVELLRIDVE
jgi:hypothetical protein